MKIICTTERKIEIEESCEKVYCCKKMKAAMIYRKTKSTYGRDLYPTTFSLTDTGIKIETHSNYDDDSHDEEINFCPWCASPVTLEKVKIDNTGLPPKEPVDVEKKRHWWN